MFYFWETLYYVNENQFKRANHFNRTEKKETNIVFNIKIKLACIFIENIDLNKINFETGIIILMQRNKLGKFLRNLNLRNKCKVT